jgi:hypothetical protein
MITVSENPASTTQGDSDSHLLHARQALAVQINSQQAEHAALKAQYGQVWSTAEMGRDFEALGFAAPFVIVQRRADHQLGSLLFQHRPRYYFSFQADR